MNTKNSSNQKYQRQETRRARDTKKTGEKPVLHDPRGYHEQERIETRMTR